MQYEQDCPNGNTDSNTINQAELVGGQAWLKQVSEMQFPLASTSKLLTDSQVKNRIKPMRSRMAANDGSWRKCSWNCIQLTTHQLIQKAIKQQATTWLRTHEPILLDNVANLKALTEAGHNVHLGKVKAHAGIEGSILADAAADKLVTQIIDAGGDLKANVADEDFEAAGIDIMEK